MIMKTYFHKHVKIKHYKRALIKHMPCASSASLVAQLVDNLPAMQETWVRSLGWDDSLEKGMATHSSILAKSRTQQSNILFHFHMCIFSCGFYSSIFFPSSPSEPNFSRRMFIFKYLYFSCFHLLPLQSSVEGCLACSVRFTVRLALTEGPCDPWC